MRKAVKKRSRNVVKRQGARKFGKSFAKNFRSRAVRVKAGRLNGVRA